MNNQESKPPKDQALFRCAHCEKTFTKSINLQYHTYRHTGNVFAQERNLHWLPLRLQQGNFYASILLKSLVTMSTHKQFILHQFILCRRDLMYLPRWTAITIDAKKYISGQGCYEIMFVWLLIRLLFSIDRWLSFYVQVCQEIHQSAAL